jgi:hypothetical protein
LILQWVHSISNVGFERLNIYRPLLNEVVTAMIVVVMMMNDDDEHISLSVNGNNTSKKENSVSCFLGNSAAQEY